MFNIYENSYKITNDVQHMEESALFIALKNILIKTFYFYLISNLFLQKDKKKITHSIMFKCLPNGIN